MVAKQSYIIKTGSVHIRILVIGGNGFIGKHVVNHALNLGWIVTSLNVSYNVQSQHANLEHIKVDIADKTSLKKALGLAEFEYVVNCGGYIDHTLFSKGGRQVLEMHFIGVINLVELLNRDTLKSFINIKLKIVSYYT